MVHYYNAGVFDVTLTVSNSAGSSTITKEGFITVYPVVGIDKPESGFLMVYPNPASGRISIRSETIINALFIHAVSGKEMLHALPDASNFEQSLESLPKGIYILTLQSDDRIIRKKLEVIR